MRDYEEDRGDNAGTKISGRLSDEFLAEFLRKRRPAMPPKLAFAIAYPYFLDQRRGDDQRDFIAVALDSEGNPMGVQRFSPGERVAIGRHTECDLRLRDPSVALRALVALLRYEGNEPRLHIWDLGTETPFSVEGGDKQRAVVASGPVYVTTHGYSIWFIPVKRPEHAGEQRPWPVSAEAAYDALPPRNFVDERPASGGPAPKAKAHPRPSPRRDDDQGSMVASMPPVNWLKGEPTDAQPFGVLSLEAEGERQRATLSLERLEQGVLIGRYDRCALTFQDSSISRVHALLVRIGNETWLIDVGSTQGLRRGGVYCPATVLNDRGDFMTLSHGHDLNWRQSRRAS